jgi:hypothetical protein
MQKVGVEGHFRVLSAWWTGRGGSGEACLISSYLRGTNSSCTCTVAQIRQFHIRISTWNYRFETRQQLVLASTILRCISAFYWAQTGRTYDTDMRYGTPAQRGRTRILTGDESFILFLFHRPAYCVMHNFIADPFYIWQPHKPRLNLSLQHIASFPDPQLFEQMR